MTKNNIDSFYSERGAWTDYVCDRKDFSHAEFRVAYFIASKTNPYDGCMWYSMKRIAEESMVGLATVKAAIEKLDRSRLMIVGRRKMGRQTVNTYMWRMPLDAKDQAFKAVKKTRKKTGGRKPRVSSNEI
jgi:hypothetical protein